MKLRIVSSIIAILILFFFLFYLPQLYFYIFLFIIVSLSQFELHKLLYQKINMFYLLTILFNAVIFISMYKGNYNIFFELFTIFSLLIFTYLVLTFRNFSNTSENIIKFIFSLIYISMFSIYAVLIYEQPNGQFLLLHLLIICWATDSFAFLCGKNFGIHKLYEAVSPNKTVEGFIGGLAGGAIFGIFGKIFVDYSIGQLLIISLVISLTCVIGDLFESMLKRHFNVKDSGALFPGHGGILDRIDGVLFAIPVYYLMLT